MSNSNSTEPALGAVSAFDLEPNPFEQSFASSKKPENVAPNTDLPPARSKSMAEVKPIAISVSPRGSSVNYKPEKQLSMSGVGNGIPGGTNTPGFTSLEKRFGSQTKPPQIQSPQILTPGGTKRLPAILLSPSLLQTDHTSPGLGVIPQNQGGVITKSTESPAATVSSACLPLSAGGRNMLNVNYADSGTLPNFLLNLPRTGLTPNESNLRTGLSPSILTQQYPFPILPAISNNQNSSNATPTAPVSIPNNIDTKTGHQHTSSATLKVNEPLVAAQPKIADGTKFVSQNLNASSVSKIPETAKYVKPGVDTLASLASAVPIMPPFDKSMESRDKAVATEIRVDQPSNKKAKRRASSVESKMKIKREKTQVQESSSSRRDRSSSETPCYDGSAGDEDEQERRRKEFLERNRLAASKFRKRKKEYIKKIEYELKVYKEEYRELSVVMGQLSGIVPINNLPENANEKEAGTSMALVPMLENAIKNNDMHSILSINDRLKRIVYGTQFIARKGRLPYEGDANDNNHMKKT